MHFRMKQCLFTTDSLQFDAIQTRDHIFLCGDFNVTLPVDKVCVKNRCGEANRNSKILQSFVERHDPLAANAYTRQKHRSLPTFDGPNWRNTRLDWISALFAMEISSGNPIHIRHL